MYASAQRQLRLLDAHKTSLDSASTLAVALAQLSHQTARELTLTTIPQLALASATKKPVPKHARTPDLNSTQPLASASALPWRLTPVLFVLNQGSGTFRPAHAFAWETKPALLVTHTIRFNADALLKVNRQASHLMAAKFAQALVNGTTRLASALAM